MQVNEELVRQITEAVMTQLRRQKDASGTEAPEGEAIVSLAGRERINPVKSDYSSYPKAGKGTDPKDRRWGCISAGDQEDHLRDPSRGGP